jgi:hypothetical protein
MINDLMVNDKYNAVIAGARKEIPLLRRGARRAGWFS